MWGVHKEQDGLISLKNYGNVLDGQAERQQGDLISFILFFKIRELEYINKVVLAEFI
jgi:hypothetical protein